MKLKMQKNNVSRGTQTKNVGGVMHWIFSFKASINAKILWDALFIVFVDNSNRSKFINNLKIELGMDFQNHNNDCWFIILHGNAL